MDPISLKSGATFKEQCSGKLVEPAGNKIQADPFPPCTPCNDTSAQLTITAPFFAIFMNSQELRRRKRALKAKKNKIKNKKSNYSMSSVINL